MTEPSQTLLRHFALLEEMISEDSGVPAPLLTGKLLNWHQSKDELGLQIIEMAKSNMHLIEPNQKGFELLDRLTPHKAATGGDATFKIQK